MNDLDTQQETLIVRETPVRKQNLAKKRARRELHSQVPEEVQNDL